MKKILILLLFVFPVMLWAQPCTTSNAAGCSCPDGADTCYLLPDITISWFAIKNYLGGPTEYSQSGNGANDGRLRITGSTPNIGYGPFTVRGTNYYVCGNDTIYDPSGNVTCPDGSTPSNLLYQRIYKKINGTMTYEDRFAGAMTYHPTHGHNHVDDWVVMTLRMADANEPDTLKWPIVGTGAKLGFCLMDFGTCDYYNGHCRDHQVYNGGNILTGIDFPNFGLGGGSYGCSPVEQGISVGYTDIYSENLDGMWIDIPPGTCNGDYWIVAQVDYNNNFLESNEDNNWTAVPVTLTHQTAQGAAVAEIDVDGEPFICNNSSVELSANTASNYEWSTGDTTQTINVSQPGEYYVEVQTQCGSAVSDTVLIQEIPSEVTAVGQDTTCLEGAMVLTANGTGDLYWYDQPTGGTLLDTGAVFNTPFIQSTNVYYVENISAQGGSTTFSEPHDYAGSSPYSGTQYNGYITFDCFSAFTLRSVKVYTDYSGNRTIELRNNTGSVLQDTTVYIDQGTSRITLNFSVIPGTDYQLGTNDSDNIANFGYVSPDLRRSSSGVSYPYIVDGVLSLKGSPYGSSYYYYFYDWEVIGGEITCSSPREAVTAVVLDLPVVSITGLDTVYQITSAPVTLTGQPAGGTFSGSGMNGSIFDPATAGIGQHTISYTYMDQNGCENEASKKVTVVYPVIADAGADIEICQGEGTMLSAQGGVYYLWNTGDTTAAINVRPDSTTVYTVTVSDNFGNTDDDDITVSLLPLPAVSFSGLKTTYVETDAPESLTGTPVGGSFYGQGMTGNIFDPNLAGVGGPYEITYYYSDTNGCSNSQMKLVTVTKAVGIPSIDQTNGFDFYPNPTNGIVTFEFEPDDSGDGLLKIYDAIGRLVIRQQVELHKGFSTGRLSLTKYPNGVYLVELITVDKKITTKIIKN